jgi:hypothetical protein
MLRALVENLVARVGVLAGNAERVAPRYRLRTPARVDQQQGQGENLGRSERLVERFSRGAERASLFGMVGPLLTIGLGSWLLDEPISLAQIAGAGLVLIGGANGFSPLIGKRALTSP